jgi:hypothetical protein
LLPRLGGHQTGRRLQARRHAVPLRRSLPPTSSVAGASSKTRLVGASCRGTPPDWVLTRGSDYDLTPPTTSVGQLLPRRHDPGQQPSSSHSFPCVLAPTRQHRHNAPHRHRAHAKQQSSISRRPTPTYHPTSWPVPIRQVGAQHALRRRTQRMRGGGAAQVSHAGLLHERRMHPPLQPARGGMVGVQEELVIPA